MRLVLSVFVLAAAWTVRAQGTFEAIVSHDNPSPVVTSTSATAGWTFQPTDWMAVMDLGCFDDIFLNNETINSIQVGLWTSGGALLASNLITRTSPIENESRYEPLVDPVGLEVGQVYHIGAYSPDGSMSIEVCGPSLGGTLTVSTNLFLQAAAQNAGSFGFPPEQAGTDGLAYLGPNFRWGVPEPSSALLLGLAALLFAARRRPR
jgi:hypothetical protein